jgi:hypothetical protein
LYRGGNERCRNFVALDRSSNCSPTTVMQRKVLLTSIVLGLFAEACGNGEKVETARVIAELSFGHGRAPFPLMLEYGAVDPQRVALDVRACAPDQTPCDDLGDPPGCVACDSAFWVETKHRLNQLDGFSITADWSVTFSGPIAANTLGRESAFIIDVESGRIVSGEPRIRKSKIAGGPMTILLEVEPLAPKKEYAAVITAGIHDEEGRSVVRSPIFEALASGDPSALTKEELGCSDEPCVDRMNSALERAHLRYERLFSAVGELRREEIALMWSAVTGDHQKTLTDREDRGTISRTVTATIPARDLLGVERSQLNVDSVRIGCVWTSETEPISFVVSVPKTATTGLALFVHDFGRNRYDMLGIANDLGGAGWMVAAIKRR